VRDLTATVHRLQVAAQQDQDSGSAALRAKVAQLETLVKAKDKELERMRWVLTEAVNDERMTSTVVCHINSVPEALRKARSAPSVEQP
jgi:hypothetical protein